LYLPTNSHSLNLCISFLLPVGGNPPANKRDKSPLNLVTLLSKRNFHDLLDLRACDPGSSVLTVAAAAYKRCTHCCKEGSQFSNTFSIESFTLSTRSLTDLEMVTLGRRGAVNPSVDTPVNLCVRHYPQEILLHRQLNYP